jgi:hypothetical protein
MARMVNTVEGLSRMNVDQVPRDKHAFLAPRGVEAKSNRDVKRKGMAGSFR